MTGDPKNRVYTQHAELLRQLIAILDLSPNELFIGEELRDALDIERATWRKVKAMFVCDPRVEIVHLPQGVVKYKRKLARAASEATTRMDMTAILERAQPRNETTEPTTMVRRPATPPRSVESVPSVQGSPTVVVRAPGLKKTP